MTDDGVAPHFLSETLEVKAGDWPHNSSPHAVETFVVFFVTPHAAMGLPGSGRRQSEHGLLYILRSLLEVRVARLVAGAVQIQVGLRLAI
jgi:hypothetical protein